MTHTPYDLDDNALDAITGGSGVPEKAAAAASKQGATDGKVLKQLIDGGDVGAFAASFEKFLEAKDHARTDLKGGKAGVETAEKQMMAQIDHLKQAGASAMMIESLLKTVGEDLIKNGSKSKSKLGLDDKKTKVEQAAEQAHKMDDLSDIEKMLGKETKSHLKDQDSKQDLLDQANAMKEGSHKITGGDALQQQMDAMIQAALSRLQKNSQSMAGMLDSLESAVKAKGEQMSTARFRG